jgi:hypothetical protein
MNKNNQVVVGTYRFSGIGSAETWFRRTSTTAAAPVEFFKALDAVKKDSGHNGFVGAYTVPKEFMTRHGWEADTYHWPPCNAYTETPKISEGWLTRQAWLEGYQEKLVPDFRPGYFTKRLAHNCAKPVCFVTAEEHRWAYINGNKIIYWADLKDGCHSIVYELGDQRAAAFVLIKDGKLVDSVSGCGDDTPDLVADDSAMLAAKKILYTTDRDEALKDSHKADEAFWSAADGLGVSAELRELHWKPYRTETDRSRIAELEGLVMAAQA